jgi:hypothetical protein
MVSELENVLNTTLPKVKEAGAFGVVVEGIKCLDKDQADKIS